MVKLTLQYGEAYVSATSAFVLCSRPVLLDVGRGTNREQNGNKGEQTVNNRGGVGVAAPPANRRRPVSVSIATHSTAPYSHPDTFSISTLDVSIHLLHIPRSSLPHVDSV